MKRKDGLHQANQTEEGLPKAGLPESSPHQSSLRQNSPRQRSPRQSSPHQRSSQKTYQPKTCQPKTYQQRTNLPKTNRLVIAVVLTLVLSFVFVWFVQVFRPADRNASIQNGIIDLTGFDFKTTNAILPLGWDYYPGKLYGPDDFAHYNTGEPKLFTSEDRKTQKTGTYRAVLLLGADAGYGIDARTLDFATTIYVNGKEILRAGDVNASAEEFVPKIKYYTLPVESQNKRIEIIIQYANYFHPEGGDMQKIVFGLYGGMFRNAQVYQFSEVMIGAALLVLALYYLMLFIAGRSFPNFAFALCLFYLATRKEFFILTLLPQDVLYTPIFRYLYMINVLTAMALLLLAYGLYPDLLPRRFTRIVVRGAVIISLGLVVTAVLLTPYQVALMATPSYLIFIPTIICIGWIFGKLMKQGNTVDRLMALGVAILFISLLFEISLQRPFALETVIQSHIPDVIKHGYTACAMLAFAICQMIALSFENAELARLNRMKTEFLQNMSHELKTPLAVISTDVLNVADQIEYEMDKEDIQKSLKNAQEEIMRMSRMVNSAMEYPTAQETSKKSEPMDIAPVLRFCADTYHSITRKKNNRLSVDVPDSLPLVYANADMIVQVLTNLLSNANRHTSNGEIAIRAAEGDGKVVVTVMDSGEGIGAELLPHVFERGVSGRNTGRSGFGLSISKSIIEALGGEISLASEYGKGTAATFVLPVCKRK